MQKNNEKNAAEKIKSIKMPNGYIDVRMCRSNSVPHHSHDFLELVYILKGTAIHTLGDAETIVGEGDYFIVDYNTMHGYKPYKSAELVIINCLFLPAFIDKILKNCRKFSEVADSYMIRYNYETSNINPANYVFHDNDGMIKRLIERIKFEFDKKESGYLEILRCMLIEIIIYTMRYMNEKVDIPTGSIAEYVMKYTTENYMEKNVLSDISKQLNFSLSYISRRFKLETGTSFCNYLQKTRVEHSCRMIANSDKKIIDIAQEVGYSDIKFFNFVFKKQLGITPREFRKQHL